MTGRPTRFFCVFDDQVAFHTGLPSQLFEHAATGTPILAGVSGYAAEYLHPEVPGVHLFKPCDSRGLEQSVTSRPDSPNAFREKFAVAKP